MLSSALRLTIRLEFTTPQGSSCSLLVDYPVGWSERPVTGEVLVLDKNYSLNITVNQLYHIIDSHHIIVATDKIEYPTIEAIELIVKSLSAQYFVSEIEYFSAKSNLYEKVLQILGLSEADKPTIPADQIWVLIFIEVCRATYLAEVSDFTLQNDQELRYNIQLTNGLAELLVNTIITYRRKDPSVYILDVLNDWESQINPTPKWDQPISKAISLAKALTRRLKSVSPQELPVALR